VADLRNALHDMTHDGSAISTYPGKLQAIAEMFPHTICALPSHTNAQLDDFNCVMHAFGLIGRFECPCDHMGRFHADTIFVRHLVDCGSLNPCGEVVGGLVVWSKHSVIRHVGVIAGDDRAISKWGIGYIFEHGLLEVPQDFGSELTFYSSLSSDNAWDLFKRYFVAGRKKSALNG
jgi:hypothetical protein